MRFASFLSGGFITDIVINPPERELSKRTSVQWSEQFLKQNIFQLVLGGLSDRTIRTIIIKLKNRDLETYRKGLKIQSLNLVKDTNK